MEELDKDIDVGIKYLIGGNFENSRYYDDVFLHTNESISEYYDKFPVNNGNVLTVSSGGDHILQAVYENALSIDAFDLNRFAIYIAKLKIAAVKVLDYNEFNEFFNYSYMSNLKMFNFGSYKKIRDNLDDKDRKFWDMMYEKGLFHYNYERLVFSLSSFDNGNKNYAKEENFYITKDNLDNSSINFYHSDYFDIFDKLPSDKKYDAIFLSNLYDWLSFANVDRFFKMIDVVTNNYLTERGMIALYAPVREFSEIEIYDGNIERMGNKLVVAKKRVLTKV